MQPLLKNVTLRLMRRHASGLIVIAAVCVSLASAPLSATDTSSAKNEDVNGGGAGPTLRLSYNQKTFEANPITSFMYFIPLIATTPVDRQTSAGNTQEIAIVSFKRKESARTFTVSCEFEIRGSGFHRITFNAPAVILRQRRYFAQDATLTSLLDYIQLEGDGLGRIDVIGTIEGSIRTVTEVDLRFNVGGQKSPVTIGLYDVVSKDGQYTYANRSNRSVARVSTITFLKSDSVPTMGVTVASVMKAGAAEGFFARLKGAIANLLIRPPQIKSLGNDTMLDFGMSLLEQKPEFTFPLAKNITTDVTVAGAAPAP